MPGWLISAATAVLVLSACTASPTTGPATPAAVAPTSLPAGNPPVSPPPVTAPGGAGAARVPGASAGAVDAGAAPVVPAAPQAQPTKPPSGQQQITVNMLQGEPDNIDPSRSSFNTEAAVIRQVFEPLLNLSPQLQPVPAAARSFDVSSDGKVYTFHMDPNGKFSDGTPVTAQNFEYSYKRILDPKIAAEYASFFVGAGIVGAKDYNSGKAATADGVGVKAKDTLTLEIALDQAIGYLPDLVALWVVPPLRQDVISKNPDNWTQDPSTYVGNGPFRVTEWVHQDHITLEPNPYYAGTKPILQKITLLMVTNNAADYAAYRNNERDWTLVPDADVASVRVDQSLSAQIRTYTELTTFWLIMNNGAKPLDNPLVRKALSKAIDRAALIRDITQGVGLPATSYIPPGMPGYQADLGKDIAFDSQGAKDLLRQAGYNDPAQFPKLVFKYATTSANQARAEFIQAQLKQNLGIQIELQSLESKAYQADYKAKNYQLAFGGWGADYPDPQDWLGGLFSCNASNNKYNYCNAQFDQLAAKGDSLTDQNARLQAYAQAQQLLVADLPVAPLFYRGRMVLVKPWVQNLIITPQDDYPGDRFLNLISETQH